MPRGYRSDRTRGVRKVGSSLFADGKDCIRYKLRNRCSIGRMTMVAYTASDNKQFLQRAIEELEYGLNRVTSANPSDAAAKSEILSALDEIRSDLATFEERSTAQQTFSIYTNGIESKVAELAQSSNAAKVRSYGFQQADGRISSIDDKIKLLQFAATKLAMSYESELFVELIQERLDSLSTEVLPMTAQMRAFSSLDQGPITERAVTVLEDIAALAANFKVDDNDDRTNEFLSLLEPMTKEFESLEGFDTSLAVGFEKADGTRGAPPLDAFLIARDAINIARDHLRQRKADFDYAQLQFPPDSPQANGVITAPEQVLAPFQFEVSSNRLSVMPQPRTPKPQSTEIAASVLQVLIASAEDIDDDLNNSNVSNRLKRAFRRLTDSLSRNDDVIAIALLNDMFGDQVRAAEPELSDSLNALLTSFHKQVGSFAAQFEEWQRYIDNNAEVDFTPPTMIKIAAQARAMASALDGREYVDPKVPEALRTVAEWAEDTKTPRVRSGAAFSLLNIFAEVFGKLIQTAKDQSAELVIKTLATVLLAYALASAEVYTHTLQGSWLVPVLEYAQKLLLK